MSQAAGAGIFMASSQIPDRDCNSPDLVLRVAERHESVKEVDDAGLSLQERLLAAIFTFPGRLDAMETRDEEACRRLASRLAELAEEEFERRTAAR